MGNRSSTVLYRTRADAKSELTTALTPGHSPYASSYYCKQCVTIEHLEFVFRQETSYLPYR